MRILRPKKLNRIGASLALSLLTTVAQGAPTSNHGLGLTTCNKYLLTQGVTQRAYTNSWGGPVTGTYEDRSTFEAYRQWFLGYITGMEVAGLIAVVNNDDAKLGGKLDFYCRANQTQSLAEAAKKVAAEFRTR